MELCEMADEYRKNADNITKRILELNLDLQNIHGLELRRKLRKRISYLRILAAEAYEIANHLKNYYE